MERVEKMDNNKKYQLTLFHGDKGGTGKSTACMFYASAKLYNEEDPVIVEGDMTNPDVERMFKRHSDKTYKIDFSHEDGWFELSSLIERYPKHEVIVSTPAGYGNYLNDRAEDFREEMLNLKCDLKIFFLMNRQSDSIYLLDEVFEKFNPVKNPHIKIIAVKNEYFGAKEHFYRFDESNICQKMANMENCYITSLPELYEKVLDLSLESNIPFYHVAPNHHASKHRLHQWLKKCENKLLDI